MAPDEQPPLFDYELFLLDEGAKDIVKREMVPVDAVGAFVAAQQAEGRFAAYDLRLRYGGGTTDNLDYRARDGGFVTTFIARSRDAATEALELHRRELRTGPDVQADAVAAMEELGRRLGYPSCCTHAYANGTNAPQFHRGTAAFHLDPYHRTAGPFSPLLSRLAFEPAYISHSPCTYRCEASIAIAQRVLNEIERRDPALAAQHRQQLAQPILFWNTDVHVRFDGALEGDRLRYRGFTPGRSANPSPLFLRFLEALKQGDSVTASPNGVQVRAGARVLLEVADIEPGMLPVWFNWDERWFPYDRAPRLALLDLRTTGDDFFPNELSTLGGDLLRQGVPVSYFRAAIGRSSAQENDAALACLEERIVADGHTAVMVERCLTPELLQRLRRRGLRVLVGQASGNEPADTLDVELSRIGDVETHRRRRERMQAVIAALQRPLPTPTSGLTVLDQHELLASPEPQWPFHPILHPKEVEGVPALPMLRWHFRGNDGCPYSKPYSDPAADSYLPSDRGGISLRGCNFCEMGGDYTRAKDRVDVSARLTKEIDYVLQRSPIRQVVIGDTYPHPYLGELVENLRRRKAHDLELLVQTRPDWLLRSRQELLDLLPTLGEMRSMLVLYLIGFENFSQDELDRQDKGITVEQNIQGIELLRELERNHPGRFSATRYKSHGFLLFNPWTTLEDLARNARVMEQVRFHEFRSHALLTRLRLYRRLPSFYKAEQEGLLIENYDQSEKSSSRRIGYAPEYPWRSKDPAADQVFALVSKLHDDVAPEGHAQLLGLAVEFLRQPGVGELPVEERRKAFVDAHRGQLKKPEASRPPAPPPPKRTDTVDVWKLINEGKYDEATAIAQAMEPSPHQQRILQQVELQRLFREAVGHRQTRTHPLAAAAYEKIIALAPEDAEGHRGLAMTLWELNRRQEAGAAYAKYCALNGLPPPEPNAMPR